MFDLTGFVDPHVHSAPDLVPRLLDDIAVARQARAAGMAGVIVKSHTALTADRAIIAEQLVPGIRVWGGLVLNRAAGGFNPAAVEAALGYGAAEIWMPTMDAASHRAFHGQPGQGLAFDDDGPTGEAIHEILQLIAEHDVILGTGHLGVGEIGRLAQMARRHGVRKMLVTHPEAPFIAMPVSVQRELAALGCRFERTWVLTTPTFGGAAMADRLIQNIKEVGVESTVLATDLGQAANPPPVEGFRAYGQACLDAGLTESDVRRMGATNIEEWLAGVRATATVS